MKEGTPITIIEQAEAVRRLWDYLYEYPIELSLEAAKLEGEIGEEHRHRIDYFWKLLTSPPGEIASKPQGTPYQPPPEKPL